MQSPRGLLTNTQERVGQRFKSPPPLLLTSFQDCSVFPRLQSGLNQGLPAAGRARVLGQSLEAETETASVTLIWGRGGFCDPQGTWAVSFQPLKPPSLVQPPCPRSHVGLERPQWARGRKQRYLGADSTAPGLACTDCPVTSVKSFTSTWRQEKRQQTRGEEQSRPSPSD